MKLSEETYSSGQMFMHREVLIRCEGENKFIGTGHYVPNNKIDDPYYGNPDSVYHGEYTSKIYRNPKIVSSPTNPKMWRIVSDDGFFGDFDSYERCEKELSKGFVQND